MIVGQKKLCHKVDGLTLDTLPRTLLLSGEFGCGKHLLLNHIAEKFGLEVEDISDNISAEKIDMITNTASPKIYLIEVKKLTVKNENMILKFLEEPLKNAYIVLIADNKYNIIPTIINRCQIWEFQPYSEDVLYSFINENYPEKSQLLSIATTPGKVLLYQQYKLSDIVSLCHKIFTNIGRANFANALTISRHIAFKDEKDKFDFYLFIELLLKTIRDMYLGDNSTPKYLEMYKLTRDLYNNSYVFNVDKKHLFENYLINLKLMCDEVTV